MNFHISIVLLVITTVCALPRINNEGEVYHVQLYNVYETVPISELEDLLDCIMYGKSCNPMREAYRGVYPGIMIEQCKQCTKEQKYAGYLYFNRIAKDSPHKLTEFKKLFDPENKYYDSFYSVLKASAV